MPGSDQANHTLHLFGINANYIPQDLPLPAQEMQGSHVSRDYCPHTADPKCGPVFDVGAGPRIRPGKGEPASCALQSPFPILRGCAHCHIPFFLDLSSLFLYDLLSPIQRPTLPPRQRPRERESELPK